MQRLIDLIEFALGCLAAIGVGLLLGCLMIGWLREERL